MVINGEFTELFLLITVVRYQALIYAMTLVSGIQIQEDVSQKSYLNQKITDLMMLALCTHFLHFVREIPWIVCKAFFLFIVLKIFILQAVLKKTFFAIKAKPVSQKVNKNCNWFM